MIYALPLLPLDCPVTLPTRLSPRLACTVDTDADVRRLGDGRFYNDRLGAPNVWEIELDEALVDEAAALFCDGAGARDARGCAPVAALVQPGARFSEIETDRGAFFAQRVSWSSNVCWLSADDSTSFGAFQRIFDGMRLAERFAAVVPHRSKLALYSGFFVTRSWCEAHNWHEDFLASARCSALTLIAPLADYTQTETFQLSYAAADADTDAGVAPGQRTARRYTYAKGRAIVFGSGFVHSTEPGRSLGGETHAFLCFTFGTDEQAAWPEISETLGSQSRIVRHPDGELRLSELGEERARGRPRRARID